MNVKDNNFAIVSDVFRSDLDIYINTFTDNHLLLYVYLQRFNNYRNEVNFCMSWLYEDLHIINNKKLQSELISCFADLVEFKLIELVNNIDVKSINRNARLIVKLTRNEKENNFTMIYDSEIDKILGLDVDIRQKKSALLIYCIIASRINNTSKYCYPSYSNFMDDLRMENNNRISETIELLQNNGLIAYANVGSVAIYGDVEKGNNVYVLCVEDDYKVILERAIEDRMESYRERGYSVIKSKNGDKKRSLSALIRHRQNKYDDGILDNKGNVELLQYEKEYYELIKDNQDAMLKQRFVLFNIGQPNPMLGYGDIDIETGEILGDELTEDIEQEQSYKRVELQNIEKILRYYKNNFDNLSKAEKQKAKELVGEYQRLRLDLEIA